MSEDCSQEITHICRQIPITGFAAWFGRYGLKNTYWHGKHHPTDAGCRCHYEKNCDTMIGTNTNLCNCDSRYPQSIDKGILRFGLSLAYYRAYKIKTIIYYDYYINDKK